MRGLIVTGIGTDVGKTYVATVLAAGLGWPYWKPVQTGAPPDRETVARYGVVSWPERYHLPLPAAPLVAAQKAGLSLSWEVLSAPPPAAPLVIEGAGGLFVPLTESHFMIDLFAEWALPLVLVVRPYLGAMNHTWLSLEAIQRRGLPFLGIVLNGTTGDVSEGYFRRAFPLLGEMPWGPLNDPARVFVESGLAAALQAHLSLPSSSSSSMRGGSKS